MALQPGTSLQEQFNNISKQYVGLDRREKLQQLRSPDRIGTETAWTNTSPSGNFRNTEGSRFAGFKEVNNTPDMDQDTANTLKPITGTYKEASGDVKGYYGNYNPWDQQQAGDYLKSSGLREADYGTTSTLESIFGRNVTNTLPKAYGKQYMSSSVPVMQTGIGGYQQRMRPDGYSYDILGPGESVLGTGYYGYEDALKNMLKQRYDNLDMPNTTPQYNTGTMASLSNMPWGNMLNGAMSPAMQTVLDTMPTKQKWMVEQEAILGKADTDTKKMELFSQLVNPENTGFVNAHQGNSQQSDYMSNGFSSSSDNMFNRMTKLSQMGYNQDVYDKSVPQLIKSVGDKKTSVLSGDKAMLGSTPIMADGKVIGYTNSTSGYTPTTWKGEAHESYKSGPSFDRSTNAFDYTGTGGNWASLNNPDWWKANALNTGNGYFMGSDAAASNPGFTSYDDYQSATNDYEKKAGLTSTLGKMGTAAILGMAGGAAGGALLGGTAGSAIGSAVPGMIQGVAQGQSLGDVLKTGGITALGGYLGGAYGGDLGSMLGGQELAPELGGGLIKAGVQAGGAALRGGGARGALAAGLGSIGGDIAGLGIGEAVGGDLGKYVGNIGGGAVKTGLQDYIKTGKLNMDNIGMSAASQGIAGLGNLFMPAGGTMGEERQNRINAGKSTQSLADIGTQLAKRRKA